MTLDHWYPLGMSCMHKQHILPSIFKSRKIISDFYVNLSFTEDSLMCSSLELYRISSLFLRHTSQRHIWFQGKSSAAVLMLIWRMCWQLYRAFSNLYIRVRAVFSFRYLYSNIQSFPGGSVGTSELYMNWNDNSVAILCHFGGELGTSTSPFLLALSSRSTIGLTKTIETGTGTQFGFKLASNWLQRWRLSNLTLQSLFQCEFTGRYSPQSLFSWFILLIG